MTASRPTTRSTRPARHAALAVPAIALLLLAGCSVPSAPDATDGAATPESSAPSADASGQTKQEACDALLAGLQEFATVDSAKLQEDLVNDPQAAIATIDQAEQVMVDAADSVTNEEVEPLAQDAADATRTYFATIRAAAEDPANADVSNLQAQLTEFTDSIAALEGACS